MNNSDNKIYIGIDVSKNIKDIIKKIDPSNILIIHGNKSYLQSGAQCQISRYTKKYTCHYFSDFSPNPKIEDIKKMHPLLQDIDLIIGVGGGSVIDVAKYAKLSYYKKTEKIAPLLVVTTTIGNGSEATYFIVYYDGLNKISDGDPNISHPDYYVGDPSFTLTLPHYRTACCSMDILSQSIEALWSKSSTNIARNYAIKSIHISLNEIENSVNNPTLNNRTNMMIAAYLSGKAIDISKTTACHAIAYFMTAKYNIPHGHAVALTLPEIIEYNFESIDNKNQFLSSLNCSNLQEVKNNINSLMDDIKLERKLSHLGIQRDDLDTIASSVNMDRLKNNPREMTKKDVLTILTSIF